jgi:hypothetical protein
MSRQQKSRLAGFCLLGLLTAGCGAQPAIYIETTIHQSIDMLRAVGTVTSARHQVTRGRPSSGGRFSSTSLLAGGAHAQRF